MPLFCVPLLIRELKKGLNKSDLSSAKTQIERWHDIFKIYYNIINSALGLIWTIEGGEACIQVLFANLVWLINLMAVCITVLILDTCETESSRCPNGGPKTRSPYYNVAILIEASFQGVVALNYPIFQMPKFN